MLTRTDAHYTPAWLADRLAEELEPVFSAVRAPRVADFAVGDGSLLDAVERRFGKRRLIATDVDRGSVRRLRHARPHWLTGTCDLLSPASRRASPLVDNGRRRLHAVVLNPPFSYRGAAAFPAFGGALHSSPALACLAASIEQVVTAGTVIALLPTSALSAQKDELVWQAIHRFAEVIHLETFPRGAFPGAHADVALLAVSAIDRSAMADAVVAASPSVPSRLPTAAWEAQLSEPDVRVHRGSLPMHLADVKVEGPDAIGYIHSTDLQDRGVLVRRWVTSRTRLLQGPAVLLPRVGQPRRDKVALLGDGEGVVLSDCVIGLACPTRTLSQRLATTLDEHWDDVEAAYHGSCAPYLTMRDLQQLVEKMGFSVQQ